MTNANTQFSSKKYSIKHLEIIKSNWNLLHWLFLLDLYNSKTADIRTSFWFTFNYFVFSDILSDISFYTCSADGINSYILLGNNSANALVRIQQAKTRFKNTQ